MNLLPHQYRVISEKANLDEKLTRLVRFIESERFAELLSEEQERMQRQCRIMGEYSDVLQERITAFTPEASGG